MNKVCEPGLVLYLPLHEPDGDGFISCDAYGHACTVIGAPWTPRGRCFDGSGDAIDPGDGDALAPPAALTLEAWVYIPDAYPLAQHFAVLSGSRDDSWLFVRTDGALEVWIQNTAGGDFVARTAAWAVPSGAWVHLAGTGMAGEKAAALVNGELLARSEAAITGEIAHNVKFDVGVRQFGGGENWFKGCIGEVRIYNRALAALEIRQHYLATRWRYQ